MSLFLEKHFKVKVTSWFQLSAQSSRQIQVWGGAGSRAEDRMSQDPGGQAEV